MELTIRSQETRNVTARDLSRRIGQLLNELEETGVPFVVLRYGRPAALVVPLESKRLAPRRVTVEEREDESFAMPELDEDQRLLLTAIAAGAPDPYHPDEWRGPVADFSVASVRLEIAGLVEHGSGGLWLTRKGERAAAHLAAQSGRP